MKKLLLTVLPIFLAAHFTHAQDSLKYSRKQVADDIHYLISNAADIHPNLYHDITPAELTRKSDSLISKLPDSLSVLRAYRAFAETTAFVNEGHTSLDVPVVLRQAMRSGMFKAIPVQVLDYTDNGFEANLLLPQGSIKSVKVTGINGRPAPVILNQMMALKGDLPSFRKVNAIASFRYFLAVIGISQPYVINYKDAGTDKTITLNGISEKEYATAVGAKTQNEPYTFMLLNSKYGYLNFKSMNNYDRFSLFCDSVFKMLDEQKVGKLVVDLRENSGGNSSLGRILLDYMTDKAYRMAGPSKRKVSKQFKTYIIANRDIYGNDYDEYVKKPDGSFWDLGSESLAKPKAKAHKFKGQVCFLIGPKTFSSANMLAATVKDYKLFTLIGQPTGEAANHYGELCAIKLPQTALVAFTSTTMWGRPNGNAQQNGAIEPDKLINPSSGKGDNVLQYAMEWLDGK